MSRLCFAAIVTAFILPGLLMSQPAHGLSMTKPSIGNSVGISWDATNQGVEE